MTEWVRATLDIETASLDPAEGGVVAVGVLKASEQGRRTGEVFTVKGRVVDPETGAATPRAREERRIIKKTVRYLSELEDTASIYTYNGDTFDWPFLIARAMQIDDYGDTVDQLFQLKEEQGTDLIKTDAAKKPNGYPYKLEDLLRKHGLEHSSDISGKDVPQYFENGRLDEITEYLKEDVRTTDDLVQEIVEDVVDSTVPDTARQ